MVQYLALTKIDWQLWCVQQTIGKRLSMLAVCPELPVDVLYCCHIQAKILITPENQLAFFEDFLNNKTSYPLFKN